jgi:hypothetical protein
MENRFSTNCYFEEEQRLKTIQGKEFGIISGNSSGENGNTIRWLQIPSENGTILDDGTGYHPSIWSVGDVTPRGDESKGLGPYLPLWQRSPVSTKKQFFLNVNVNTMKIFEGVLPTLIKSKQGQFLKLRTVASRISPLSIWLNP